MWQDAYADRNSLEYKILSRELNEHLSAVLKKSYGENFLGVEVYNFRKGSIIFDFTVYLKSTSSVSQDKLNDVIKKGEGSSKFTIESVNVEQKFPCKTPTKNPETQESGLERWIIVLIASGAVIVILLILVLIFVVSHYCLLPFAIEAKMCATFSLVKQNRCEHIVN